jgi:ubiquinol-cytochrome c reductase cytochrome c subunit
MRPSRFLPAACAALVAGLVLTTGVFDSTPAQASDSNTNSEHAVTTTTNKLEGSGNNNVYSTEKRVVPDVENKGEYLFIQGCSTCHGVDGKGTKDGPSLIGVGAAAADFYISSGRMPLNQPLAQAPRKKPLYNEEDRAAIVKYVASLGEGPAIPHVDEEAGDIVEGALLYSNNCAACHNSAGSGGALGRNYYAPRLDASTPEQIAEAIRIGPGAMPVFGPDTMNDQEVNSIVKYVGEITEQTGPGGISLGRLGPVSEGFLAWTLGLGVLIGFIYWIGTRV